MVDGSRWHRLRLRPRLRPAILLLLVAWLLAPATALAVEPDEVLADAALEARARAISAQLRCLVCQNQSIDDSNASLAKDLRLLVRERLIAGDSDRQVIDYLVDRYGEFVLLKPRFAGRTLALWLTPLAVLLAAAAFLVLQRRRATSAARAGAMRSGELSREERARLDRLLAEEEAGRG